MSTTKKHTPVEQATYRAAMIKDCNKWRKFLKAKAITLKDAYRVFDEKYPQALGYEAFYKNLNLSNFKHCNYVKAKEVFDALEISIVKNK